MKPMVLSLCLAGCAVLGNPAWHVDAAAFLAEAEARHPKIDHHRPIRELRRQADTVDSGIALARLVASVGDGHTVLPVFALPGDDAPTPTDRMLPLRLEWYDDGLFVTGARRDLAALLGQRVVTIGGRPAADVLREVMMLLPHATPGFAAEYAPEWLLSDFVLDGLGLVEEGTVALGFEDASVRIAPARPDDPFDWLTSRTDGAFADWASAPVERSYAPKTIALADDMSVFRLTDLRAGDEGAWDAAMRALADAARDPGRALVIDARDCPGGNGELVPDIVAAVTGSAAERSGRLYLAIGRRTHSACIMLTSAMKAQTRAVVVGQATGDGANHYGETRLVTLPESGWRVIHASEYWQTGEASDRRDHIAPDVVLPFTYAVESAGDPVVRWIKEQ